MQCRSERQAREARGQEIGTGRTGMSKGKDWAFSILDAFKIEIPSWGFANTGTRFGKYLQPAAAATIEGKFADAAEGKGLTGAVDTLALHVLWDLPAGVSDSEKILALSKETGIKPGSINPNFFQDQQYKF